MLLQSLPTNFPQGIDLTILIVGILGVIMVIYSQFVEAENRRDLVRMIGAFALFGYALAQLQVLFMIVSAGIFIAALIEFIEIYVGLHKHTPGDVREYIKRYKKQ